MVFLQEFESHFDPVVIPKVGTIRQPSMEHVLIMNELRIAELMMGSKCQLLQLGREVAK